MSIAEMKWKIVGDPIKQLFIYLPNLPFKFEDILHSSYEIDTEEGDKYCIWLEDGRKFFLSFHYQNPYSPVTQWWVIEDRTGQWRCRDGKVILITEMTDTHYKNSVNATWKKLHSDSNDWNWHFKWAALKREPRFLLIYNVDYD